MSCEFDVSDINGEGVSDWVEARKNEREKRWKDGGKVTVCRLTDKTRWCHGINDNVDAAFSTLSSTVNWNFIGHCGHSLVYALALNSCTTQSLLCVKMLFTVQSDLMRAFRVSQTKWVFSSLFSTKSPLWYSWDCVFFIAEGYSLEVACRLCCWNRHTTHCQFITRVLNPMIRDTV